MLHGSGGAASTSLWRLVKTSLFSKTPNRATPPPPAATSIIFLTKGKKKKNKASEFKYLVRAFSYHLPCFCSWTTEVRINTIESVGYMGAPEWGLARHGCRV